MNEPLSVVLFEDKHYTWLIPFIISTNQYMAFFIQNYTKLKIYVFIAVKYMLVLVLPDIMHVEIGVSGTCVFSHM